MNVFKRKTYSTLGKLAVLAVLSWGAGLVHAQASNYPNRPIRLVLGQAPGGLADIQARLMAQKLSATLGQQVVVDNKPSAGGIVAADTVAKADPDGYTLLFLTSGNAVSATLFRKLPYDIKHDFRTVSSMGFFGLVMLVDKSSDIQSVQDFITKAKANPEKYNIGTSSLGSTQNMSATLFNSLTGLQTTIVPYKTTPSLMLAMKSKDIAVAFEFISPTISLLRSGDIKALAVTSTTRFHGLPNVPTLQESGAKGYDVMAWNGISVPAKTPRYIIDRLNKEINAALALPEVRSKFQDVGIEARGSTPEELQNILSVEIDKWNNLVNTMRIERQ